MLTLYHGMARFHWEIVRRQGRLRLGKQEVRGDRRWRIVGRGGVIFLTVDLEVAAIYAGGRADKRYPTWPTGRWKLPGGIANQEGVILTTKLPAEAITRVGKLRTHAEFTYDQEIPVEALAVAAHIREGHNIYSEMRRAAQPPPMPRDMARQMRAVPRNKVLEIRGIRAPLI